MALSKGSQSVSLDGAGYPAGTYNVIAKYEGDADFASSVSPSIPATLLPSRARTATIVNDTSLQESPLNSSVPVSGEVYTLMESQTPRNSELLYQ